MVTSLLVFNPTKDPRRTSDPEDPSRTANDPFSVTCPIPAPGYRRDGARRGGDIDAQVWTSMPAEIVRLEKDTGVVSLLCG